MADVEAKGRRRRCSVLTCKKWTSYIAIACFFLAGGIEYSVILPTMFDYVTVEHDGKEWLYGLTLAAFSISNLVTGPLYGMVFDKTHRTKLIVLFANLFEIGGNFMYFAATSKYMILGSRFIVGLGAGAGAALFGELARTTSKKQRTGVFSIFMATRQIGLVIGPAFNLFLHISNFHLGPFAVSKYTSPGLFMALVWVLIEVMFVFLYFQSPPVEEEEEEEKEEGATKSVNDDVSPYNSQLEPVDDTAPLIPNNIGINSDPRSSFDENTPLISANIGINSDHSSSYGGLTKSETVRAANKLRSPPRSLEEARARTEKGGLLQRIKWILSEFIREEIIVLLAVLFITMFDQTAIEAMFVPMAERLLGWTEQTISIFYSAAGVEILISFVVVTVLSKWIGDRWLIGAGLAFELIGFTWMLGLMADATPDTPWVMWRFLVGAFFNIFGLPLFIVTSASLYSKFLPAPIQGFGQGIRRSVFSTAAILGPLWSGGTVGLGNYYVLLGVLCGCMVFVLALLLLSFPKLKERKTKR